MGKPEFLELLAFHLGPFSIGTTVLTTWLLMGLLAGVAWLGTRRLNVDSPSRLQTMLEGTMLALQQAIEDAAPGHAARLLPFHLLGEVTRTLALAVRLFGNMMSLEMAALLVLLVAGFLAPIPLLMLHIIEALVQAYIFKLMIAFRKTHPSLGRSQFWREDVNWNGVAAEADRSDHSRTLAYCLHGATHQDNAI